MSIFDTLKRTSGRGLPTRAGADLFFRLQFDRKGAYLEVVDAAGKPLADLDPRQYHGPEHDVLKLIDAFQERNLFSIAWDAEADDRLYLAEHEMLLWPLQRCKRFVDHAFAPLRFADGASELVLQVNPVAAQQDAHEGLRQARLQLRHEGTWLPDPRPVTERYWLAGGVLYETLPVGPNAGLLPGFATRLAPDDLPRFLALLYSYTQHVQVHYAGYSVREAPPLTAQPTLFIEHVDASSALYLRLSSSVPGWPPQWFEDYHLTTLVEVDEAANLLHRRAVTYAPLNDAQRDLRKRLRTTQRALSDEGAVFTEESNLLIIEKPLAQAFLHEHLPALLRTYLLFGAEKLQAYQIRAAAPSLNLRLDHGIDFLEGDATLTVGADTLPLFAALQQVRERGYLQLSDGTRALVDPTYFDRLERLFQQSQDPDGVRVSFFDLPLVEELIDARTAEALPPARAIFQGFNTLQEADVPPPELQATLRPYQDYGYRWLRYLHKHRLGGCLADDMGLGKTIQTLALLAAVYDGTTADAPSLLVMPRSLLFNWARELDRFAPQLSYYTYHAPDRNLDDALQAQLILTTYDIVRTDAEALQAHRFYYVVLDEAQRIKNIDTQTSKAAMLLDAPHRLALSGTPIENNLGELYALFRFLNPAMFGSAKQFTRTYGRPIQRDGDTRAAHELRRKIYPFVLRRLKRDVARDLPERIDQTLYVDMTDAQALFYEQQRRFYRDAVHQRVAEDGVRRAQFFILKALGELRQIASIPEAVTDGRLRSPKRAVLREQIQELAANGRKALVFANFLAAVDAVGHDLDQDGLGYVTMTGATRHRQRLVEQFQDDPDTCAFLMTLKTGSLGLNLTAADTVFLFDPWWNQATEQQAIDRAHRIGQDKTVFSYRLIARGTIEEKILQLQEQKRALFDQIISADGASLKHLDEDDLDFIFG